MRAIFNFDPMKYFAITALYLLSGMLSAYAQTPTEKAVTQATQLIEHMKVFDTDGTFDLTYVKIFEKLGIDPARPKMAIADLNQKLKSIGANYTKFDLQPPGAPFSGDGQLYIIIPYSSVMEVRGRRFLSEAFLIGISENDGESWKFVDGISSTQENIRNVIPSYSGAPLPPRRVKPLE